MLLILAIAVSVLIWYSVFDISGITFYNDEPISQIVPYEDRIYIITQNGNGYMAGNYNSSSRKYRNSESYHNKKIGIPSPVMFFNGSISEILPYDSNGTLFLSNDNELYDLYDFDVTKIADNVIDADVKGTTEKRYYIVDSKLNLYETNEMGASRFISAEITQVRVYRDKIFALFTNGNLCELDASLTSDNPIVSTIYENVKTFDICDTSMRYIDGNYVFDDEDAIAAPLLNVLTQKGELYAKGAYSLLPCTRSISVHPEPYFMENWSLIGENVSEFSLASMGTIIKFNDNTCAYFGFDSNTSKNSNYSFGYKEILLNNVTDVYATSLHVCVKTKEGFYIWGRYLIYDKAGDTHDIFSGEPILIAP